MKGRGRKTLVLVLVVLTGLFITSNIPLSEGGGLLDRLLGNFKKEHKPVEPLVPEGVQIKPGFKPGKGVPIGTVQMVTGQVLVVHKGESAAYKLDKNLPVFTGDILISEEASRASIKLNDRSVIGLAPQSKLVIDKSIYDPEKNKRSSFVSLLWGKARFVVAKISGDSEYQVKTPTAVCGVRGSDFALAVTPELEETSALPGFLQPLVVGKAYAQVVISAMTMVVTGANTTVAFTGAVGGTQIVGSLSLSFATATAAASAAAALTPAMVGAILNSIFPNLAAISMPPGFREGH